MTDFLVRRDDLRVWRVAGGAGAEALAAGEVQLRVERFGLSANNITYGVAGDQLGYWRFFPAPDGWGRIPVWGFGDVVASAVEGVAAGHRFYGLFPMSSTVTMRVRADRAGFVECSEGRAELPSLYNRYLRATPEFGFFPAHDDLNAVMRPLFASGWLIADQLEDAGWYGAEAIVITSASSKTAFTTAFEIAARDRHPALIGLTSAPNRAFTEGLGCYENVLDYDDVSALPVDWGITFVDMSGAAELRRAVHEHAGDALCASIMVGATHGEKAAFAPEALPGPAPELFFAAARVDQRAEEIGRSELQRRLGTAWAAFADRVPALLQIEFHTGVEPLARAYEALVDGTADPRKGLVFSL